MVLVGQKVMEKCDAVDGLKDGLIDDPRACRFDATRDVPACSAMAHLVMSVIVETIAPAE